MGTNIQGPSLTPLYDNTVGEEGRPIHAEEDSVVAPMGTREGNCRNKNPEQGRAKQSKVVGEGCCPGRTT